MKRLLVLLFSVILFSHWLYGQCDIPGGTLSGPTSVTAGSFVTYSWDRGCNPNGGYGYSFSTNPNWTQSSMIINASNTTLKGWWTGATSVTATMFINCGGGSSKCPTNSLSVTVTGGCSDTGSGTTWNWTGDTDKDWFTACNWDRNSVPTCNSDVIIDGTAPVQPEITGATALCNTIEINSSAGGRLDLISSSSGVLTIKSITGSCP